MSKVIVDEIQTDTTDGNVRIIPNGEGKLEVKGAGGDDAMIQLNCSAQTHGVKLKSPAHSVSQSYTMILPDNNIAADKVLKVKNIVSGSGTSAVGQLEFGDVAAGITVQEEGSALSTAATTLNFVGSSVTASGTGATKTITISGGVSSDSSRNTKGGSNAGYYLASSTDFDNTVFGYNAANNIGTGGAAVKITAIGSYALEGQTLGDSSVAVGFEAMRYHGGDYSTAVGRESLKGSNQTGGSQNTAIGYRAGTANAGADFCVYTGAYSGYSNTSGNNNSMFGYTAGYNINTGSNNTCVGYGAGTSSSPSGSITTGSNNVVLGDNNVSNLYCADTSISSSDSRDKTDVTSFTIGLNWIEALRPVTYRWDRRTWYGTDEEPYGTPDGSKKTQRLHIGFLAQEALEVEKANGYGNTNDDSLILNLTDDGMSYGMKYERLVPILVNAIKELSTRVKTLEGG